MKMLRKRRKGKGWNEICKHSRYAPFNMRCTQTAGLTLTCLFLLLSPIPSEAGSGTEVSGRVSELILTNHITYSYVAVIRGSNYSITLFDSQSNLLSTAVRNSRDTLILNHGPSGDVGGEPIYEVSLAATPYPFNAPDSLQMVWIALLGKKSLLSDIIAHNSPESPGIVLSHLLLESHLNWLQFTTTNLVFADGGDGLVSQFTQYSPGNVLMGQDQITSVGLNKSLVSTLSKAANGKFIVPLAGEASNGYPILQFKAVGKFGTTAYPKEATLKRLESPQPNGILRILRQFNFSIMEVNTVEDNIEVPPIPTWATVTDFRVAGIRGKPDSYALRNAKKWPLFGSTEYRMLVQRRNMAAPRKSMPAWQITLIMLVAAAPPIFVFYLNKQRKSKGS